MLTAINFYMAETVEVYLLIILWFMKVIDIHFHCHVYLFERCNRYNIIISATNHIYPDCFFFLFCMNRIALVTLFNMLEALNNEPKTWFSQYFFTLLTGGRFAKGPNKCTVVT